MYTTVLFDLDGTLTDPLLGISNSYRHALTRLNIEYKDVAFSDFIGPPLFDVFTGKFGLSDEEARGAIELWREYFGEKGMYENEPYPGVQEMLNDLSVSGRSLYIATTKPTFYATKILEHFSLDGYFDEIVGSELDGNRSRKEELIKHVLEIRGEDDVSEVVMAGDRDLDIVGAKENGIASIGVTYGYGGEKELSDAGADRLAGDVKELHEILTLSASMP